MPDKLFNLELIECPPLERVEINGVRHYVNGEKSCYPSVTTVLSSDAHSKKKLSEWRERVGAEEAAKISRRAANRGTIVHQMIEDYVQGKLSIKATESQYFMPIHIPMFEALKSVADESIDNIRMIEGQMMSHELRVAGTVDMVAEFDGVLSIIDWKTSNKKKKKEWIRNYFIQESAYAVMFEENVGEPIEQLVTVIATETGTPQVFIEKKSNWIDSFKVLREEYELELQSLS